MPKKLDTLRSMLRIAPFPALRPRPEHAAAVAALPYDVVSTAEARALTAGNPYSFLHVSRSEIDLPPETDPYADQVYAQARVALEGLVREGILADDPEPSIYLYRQSWQGRTQTGIVCRCHIDDYAEGRIKRHELTRRDKEDDRTRHVLSIRANAGPVFLAFRDQPDIEDLVAADTSSQPLYHFTAPDDVVHTIWRSEDPMAYTEAFAAVDAAYIADGHHRAASAARAGAEMRALHPDASPEAPFHWFLAALFPAGELTILPYHRLVRDLNGLEPDVFLRRLEEIAVIRPDASPDHLSCGTFAIFLTDRWYAADIHPRLIDRADPIRSLDCDLVQRLVLEPILGISDPRSDARIDFVGGIRGTDELARRVNAGEAAIAIAMPATTMEQLLSVADAGAIMPPKSTWFEPKLRSGLLVHRIEAPPSPE